MATSVELYEALKPKLGTEAAKMLTESIATSDLTTKDDFGVLKNDFGVLKNDFGALKDDFGLLKDDFNELRREFLRMETRLLRWMLTLVLPLVLGVWASVVAVLLKA